MERPLFAVMLAGRIRQSPLREALDIPVLCLPVGMRGSLLDAWLATLDSVNAGRNVNVVVNTPDEVESVKASVGAPLHVGTARPSLQIVAEPAAWRGAAGLLCDVAGDLPENAIVLVCESKRLPPQSLKPMIDAFAQHDGEVFGVVGVCGDDEPAGVYAFTRSAIELIPSIGYFDLKEQFLPAINRNGGTIVTAKLGEAVWRLRDLESYLAAVRYSLGNDESEKPAPIRISERASISGSAVLDGCCIVESGAVIEDGAVVHDSVVLWGATVGGGAVVSGSVVGPLAQVEPRSRVVRTFIARPQLARSNRTRITVGDKPQW